jgi:hypothetical protein
MANKGLQMSTIALVVAILVLGIYVASEMIGEEVEYQPEETAGMVGQVTFEILPEETDNSNANAGTG